MRGFQAAAFTLSCLFSSEASKADTAELTNIEGRLVHFLLDLIICDQERDQVRKLLFLANLSVFGVQHRFGRN